MAADAELRIRARDGQAIAATFLRGPGPDVVVIAGATGVRREFYAGLARFLASRGHSVLTFDYRGIGGSRPDTAPALGPGRALGAGGPQQSGRRSPGGLRGFPARMQDWGELDLDAALAWALDNARPRRLLLVGHSVGGQLLGLAEHGDLVDAAVFVGSQSGYWGHWPLRQRLGIGALWFVLIPTLSPLLGRFPSSKLGLGEDLPRGVAEQWARWGRDPDYLLRGDQVRRARYAELRLPLLMLSFDGDRYAPHAAVDALASFYPGAAVERLRLPRTRTTGHFTAIKPGDPALWQRIADWLDAARR